MWQARTASTLMPTKQEMEDELNEKLGFGIEWSKLNKDDLEKVVDGIEDEDFVKQFAAAYANKKAGDVAQDQVEGWQPGQMVKMVNQMQNDEANPLDMFM